MNKDLLLGLLIFSLAFSLKFFPDFDLALLKLFNNFLFSETFFSYFTEFGNGWFVVALVIPFLSFISYKLKGMLYVPMQALILSGIYIGLATQIMKEEIFYFTRPALETIEGINYLDPIFRYAAFPSGHAATIFGTILIWLHLASQGNSAKISKLICFLAISFAVFVALSRVIIAAHWFTDILASLGLVLVVRSALSFEKFKSHLMEGNMGKYFSYFLVCLAWIGIIFFDVTEYF
tara:strand:+ start:2363 stop:3067 length:705 start_codon:yes stop_codon:yes gene_type:complete